VGDALPVCAKMGKIEHIIKAMVTKEPEGITALLGGRRVISLHACAELS
jgi:hypothetical protein